jgi:hypothetical protein
MTNLNKMLTLLLVFIISAAFLGFAYLSLSKKATTNPPLASSVSPASSATPMPALPPGWVVFEASGISISHPADFSIRNDVPETITLFKHGPTQSPGTEVYDGVIINISKGVHPETLKEFVDNEWATKTSDPIYTSVSQVTEVEIAGLKGYAFSTSALGDFDNIFLPWSETEHVYVTTLVADPGNLGFLETVETILNSIKKI